MQPTQVEDLPWLGATLRAIELGGRSELGPVQRWLLCRFASTGVVTKDGGSKRTLGPLELLSGRRSARAQLTFVHSRLANAFPPTLLAVKPITRCKHSPAMSCGALLACGRSRNRI